MKFNAIRIVGLIFLLGLVTFLLLLPHGTKLTHEKVGEPSRDYDVLRQLYHQSVNISANVNLTISMTCCGEDRMQETLTSMKSAILFSKSPITFYIFSNPQYFSNFSSLISGLPYKRRKRVQLVLNDVKYPETVDETDWKTLYKPCASLRLFLPDILVNTDAVLYVDTDVYFVSPLEIIWQHFLRLNATQVVGVTADFYTERYKNYIYGEKGINSGLMLMNFTRMRQLNWTRKITPLMNQYRGSFIFGDQDILNIFFHSAPELVFLLDCSYNFRPGSCYEKKFHCNEAEVTGVKVIHGLGRTNYYPDYSPFRDTYRLFSNMNLTDSIERCLYTPLRNALSLNILTDKKCGHISSKIYLNMEIFKDELNEEYNVLKLQ